MKLIIFVSLCFCLQFSFAQKLDINSLEKILYAPVHSVDSILKKSMFTLSEKKRDKGYANYYYTSYERRDLYKHLLRSISFMDVFGDKDTLRIVLYRTYYETDQEDLKNQLLSSGYELTSQSEKISIYKKGEITITNKISQKTVPRGKPMTAYEFELSR